MATYRNQLLKGVISKRKAHQIYNQFNSLAVYVYYTKINHWICIYKNDYGHLCIDLWDPHTMELDGGLLEKI